MRVSCVHGYTPAHDCPACFDAKATIATMRTLLEELEWSANLGQNTRGCGICEREASYDREVLHAPGCKLAEALHRPTT
jgi:hypothetical protein